MRCLVGLSRVCLIVDDHLTNHREKKQNTNRLSHNGDIKENAGGMQKMGKVVS